MHADLEEILPFREKKGKKKIFIQIDFGVQSMENRTFYTLSLFKSTTLNTLNRRALTSKDGKRHETAGEMLKKYIPLYSNLE